MSTEGLRDRESDGSAGDANYAEIGGSYSQFRQPEPAIAAVIAAALGNATTVINVGAGAGSYELQCAHSARRIWLER
jgi:hypothetical protein